MKKRIAILNACGLTSAHVSRLSVVGEVVQYAKTQGEGEAIDRLEGVNIAVADGSEIVFNDKIFSSTPTLAYLCLASTGFDEVDLDAALRNGVTVANVPSYSTESVAEHAIALIFSLMRHVPRADRAMRSAPFEVDIGNGQYDQYIGHTVRGKTLGIIGLGNIGAHVATLGLALGMNVLACSVRASHPSQAVTGVKPASLKTVLRDSDVISLNTAYHHSLKHLIGDRTIPLLKHSVMIVNTARSALVDEAALAKALCSGRVGGYGTDVLTDMSLVNPLLQLPNVVSTPHLGFFSRESIARLAELIVTNIETYAAGFKPKSLPHGVCR